MKVIIVGAGYVGLTTGAALAYLGHQVHLVEKNEAVIQKLSIGQSPIYEYGLGRLMGQAAKNISFSTSAPTGLNEYQVILIAVGTPSKSNGDADLSFLEQAALELAAQFEEEKYPLIVNKSTVPPGTAYRINTLVNNHLSERGMDPGAVVVSNPEFLREGNALYDALYPDRIVVGASDISGFTIMRELYTPILEQSFTPPEYLPRPHSFIKPAFFPTDPASAELIKYAANAFLSIKISFINEFAGLAELLDADITEVAKGMGLDGRIGEQYLQAGVGWGGSCFGKDARAVKYTASKYGYSLPLVDASLEVNMRQRKMLAGKLHSALKVIPGQTVGIMGLAFKPGTDDIRDTPAVDVIRELLKLGAFIRVYDPLAVPNFAKHFPDLKVAYAKSLDDMAAGCDALILLTEWDEFKNAAWPDLRKVMKNNVLVDGRNCLDGRYLAKVGFRYYGVGRR